MDSLTEQIIDTWNESEINFRANNYEGNFGDEQVRITPRGNGRLVLSSVHGLKHRRQDQGQDKIKEEDEGTGGLCLALGKLLDITTAVVLDGGTLPNDANNEPNHLIKTELEKAGLPASGGVLIDLHGMGLYSKKSGERFKHEQDIVIGMGLELVATATVGETLTNAFHNENMVVDLGGNKTYWRAKDSKRMTMWAQNRGVSAVQIEILDAFRQKKSSIENRARLVRALVAGINEVQTVMNLNK